METNNLSPGLKEIIEINKVKIEHGEILTIPQSSPKLTFKKWMIIFLLSIFIIIGIFGVLCGGTFVGFMLLFMSAEEMGGNSLVQLLLIPEIIIGYYLIKWIYIYGRKGITYIRNK